MIDKLKLFGEVKENINLKDYNTFKLGGDAKYLIDVTSKDSLIELIKYLNSEKVKYFILGNGSNVVFSDNYYDGVIIKLNKLNNYFIDLENKILKAEAGVYIPALVPQIVASKLKGFEWAAGLPGTIGGSIVSNAGAYNVMIFDLLKSVTIVDKSGNIKILNKNDIPHSYRYSWFKDNKNVTILEAEFNLLPGNPDESNALILDRQKRRLESQPLEYPSAGSIFRNPDEEKVKDKLEKYNLNGPFAGHLIEECGFKGKRIGNAEISEKHANFIVNLGDAKASDVRDLIIIAHDEVLKRFEIDLIIEQEFINWE